MLYLNCREMAQSLQHALTQLGNIVSDTSETQFSSLSLWVVVDEAERFSFRAVFDYYGILLFIILFGL